MSTSQISPKIARRLAIQSQFLAGDRIPATKDGLQTILRTLRCLQLDPIRAVERTQYLVVWSRLGNYEREWLHQLTYDDKWLMEYWAHAASLVLTEDYPLHQWLMRRYGKDVGSAWAKRVTAWAAENRSFSDYILHEIDQRGPLLTNEFEDRSKVPWESGGWSSGRSVAYMIDYLWSSGQLMVAKREGLKRWWDRAERVLPEWVPAGDWSDDQVTRVGAQIALKSLGLGRLTDINRHFIEKRYRNLKEILLELEQDGRIIRFTIPEWGDEPWYVHADRLPMLDALQKGQWQPRTTLLSPFDHLIRNRDRTLLMWDFFYRIEIYVPKAKRQFGYYVLPILHGDRLIGRVDPRMDYKKKQLTVNAVFVEPKTKLNKTTGLAVRRAIGKLAKFLGAESIHFGDNIPTPWRPFFL